VTDTTLKEAEAWLAAGRAAEALLAAEIRLTHAPRNRRLTDLRDRAMAAIQAMDPAFAALQLDAAVNPGKAEAQLELGHAYLATERLADAERCFKRALGLDRGSAEAHAALGVAYLAAGIDAGAEHHSRQALAADPAHVVASQTLASLMEARGESAAAQALLDNVYSRRSIYAEAAPGGLARVLVLATAQAGNTPYPAIMPKARYSRLVWYMEYARPEETPGPDLYDVVFNAIGDADLAEPSQAAVRRFLADCPKAVLNDPAKVARTRRDHIPDLLAGIPDLVVPRTVRLDAAEIAAGGLAVAAARRGFTGPTLVRPIGSHGGKGLTLAADLEAMAALPPWSGDVYLTEYVDYRSADGLFRKQRVLFVDRRPHAYHQAISTGWMVHHQTAGMGDHADWRAEEARFLEDSEGAIGARAMAAVAAIGRTLDLDYAGVDFAVMPDGRALVFEANATMLAHLEDPAGPYAHKNPHVQRIAAAFQTLLAERAGRA
jgi:tetratricopeptide (TPR) repeat protein